MDENANLIDSSDFRRQTAKNILALFSIELSPDVRYQRAFLPLSKQMLMTFHGTNKGRADCSAGIISKSAITSTTVAEKHVRENSEQRAEYFLALFAPFNGE